MNAWRNAIIDVRSSVASLSFSTARATRSMVRSSVILADRVFLAALVPRGRSSHGSPASSLPPSASSPPAAADLSELAAASPGPAVECVALLGDDEGGTASTPAAGAALAATAAFWSAARFCADANDAAAALNLGSFLNFSQYCGHGHATRLGRLLVVLLFLASSA